MVLVTDTPQQPHHNPPRRMLRNANNSELSYSNEDISSFHARVRSLIPSREITGAIPAGMQGARHDPTRVFSLPTYLPNNSSDMYTSNLCGITVPPKSVDASTELHLGSAQSESSSPQSQGSILSNGRDVFGKPSCNPSKKTTILLFGHTITSEQPLDMDYAKYKEAQGAAR